MAGLSMHHDTDDALPEALTQDILAPTASGAWGHDAVLRRVHEPLLASIFWLALGCVLWGPHKVWVVPLHAEEGEEPSSSPAGGGAWLLELIAISCAPRAQEPAAV